jgi:hypothetical protein
MLFQISENSATVTPYGSLVVQSVGVERGGAAQAYSINWCGAAFAIPQCRRTQTKTH